MDYHTRVSTNTSGAFKIGLSVFFLGAALMLRRNERWRPYWLVTFAFFVASLTNITTWYLARPFQAWLQGLLQLNVSWERNPKVEPDHRTARLGPTNGHGYWLIPVGF